MARSKGYRKVSKELRRLRSELATVPRSQWQRAQYIMSCIVAECGDWGGPSGANVTPRSCSYCRFYGHTKHSCPKRKQDVAAAADAEVQRDREWRAALQATRVERVGPTQAEIFDELGQPYVVDKYVGPILAVEEGEGDGKWKVRGGRHVPS